LDLLIFKVLLCLLCPFAVAAQEFNYIHYDTKDGLAGSTVYDMCQDKDGFMWFATANGLSRYDGTQFKNFTVKDGLSDNEVLKVFSDSKGRVWIGCFSKELCFYYKGSIYGRKECNWLSKVKLNSGALSICEDETGAVMVSDLRSVFIINNNNEVDELSSKPFFKKYNGQKIYGATNYIDGGFFLNISNGVFKLRRDSLELFHKNGRGSDKIVTLKEFPTGQFVETEIPNPGVSITLYKHTALFVSTTNGAWSIDTTAYKLKTYFLPGKKISKTINDKEGNIWFSTFGDGIFRLPSLEIRNVDLTAGDSIKDKEVFSLTSYKKQTICGLGFSKVAFVDEHRVSRVLNYQEFAKQSENNLSPNKLFSSKVLSKGLIIFGFDACLIKSENGKATAKNMIAIKSIDEIDSENIVVGNYAGVYRMTVKDLQVIDTLYHGRSTKVFYNDHKIYVGTLNGLYVVDEAKQLTYLGGLHPALARRITDIKAGNNNTIWISTNDAGVVAYSHNKIIDVISEENGLSSNICKTLLADGRFMWVGTNKGLDKIDVENKTKPILKYSSSDGLPSDVINAVLVKDSIVFVGTPKGLTFFKEDVVSNASSCDLQLLNVKISGTNYQPLSSYSLSYKNNNIGFEYVAISFKSGGDIVYHYKISGLDTAWRTTRETNLTYETLPSGSYNLQLYAVNKFGVKSTMYQVNFFISTPFWKTWWAYTIVMATLIFVTGYLVSKRNKSTERRLIESGNFHKQFAALEQQALQAQMNPHFIFNCLNSIQQYILTNDKEKANQYLTGFASLIRQTLYISDKKSIKVSEEIGFLTEYLEMEKMRFGDSFMYEIIVEESVNADFIEMPALLLQPYVENSLRHGIRYKHDGKGRAIISFEVKENMLICRIIDNGIGREKAATYRNLEHIEYQSKGMSLTEKRVKLLNTISDRQISIEIMDLKNEQGDPVGTEVIVQIPV
jgi:anti-sigma regulatory factor (Ser/Thr protein kinase)